MIALSFREALHSFTDYERSIFLRFVWARARLPLAKNLGLAQKFKIQVVFTFSGLIGLFY